MNPDFGAIWCKHCKLFHTRAAEAVYPLGYLYRITDNKNYLECAIKLGNWLIRQQVPDGSWKETPEDWTGTSTDQLLMMAQAFPILKNQLTENERKAWLNSIKLAGDYLINVMTPEFASIKLYAERCNLRKI